MKLTILCEPEGKKQQLGDKCFRWNNRKNEIWTQTLP